MNSTQKAIFEWPALMLIVWLVQSFEISLSKTMLFGLTHIQICPVIILYLSLTRDWGQLAVLATVFAYVGSAVASVNPMIYVSVYLWTAFIAKILVTTFALENRNSFTSLVLSSVLFAKLLYSFILSMQGFRIQMGVILQSSILMSIVSAVLAYLLFPLFVKWDRFFEHDVDGSRDLNPVI